MQSNRQLCLSPYAPSSRPAQKGTVGYSNRAHNVERLTHQSEGKGRDAPGPTADMNQPISTVPTVATRPFRTETTLTIWSMAIIAMIAVRWRWFRIEEINQV